MFDYFIKNKEQERITGNPLIFPTLNMGIDVGNPPFLGSCISYKTPTRCSNLGWRIILDTGTIKRTDQKESKFTCLGMVIIEILASRGTWYGRFVEFVSMKKVGYQTPEKIEKMQFSCGWEMHHLKSLNNPFPCLFFDKSLLPVFYLTKSHVWCFCRARAWAG